MSENDENDKRTKGSNNPKKLRLVTFTGAAGLLGLAVSFAIFAFNSHKQKSKKKGTLSLAPACLNPFVSHNADERFSILGLPGCDTVRVNLSAKEILDLADEIISNSTRVHDAVASVPLNKVKLETHSNSLTHTNTQKKKKDVL